MKSEKVLLISDLHLSVNFRPKKYKYLENLFNSADRIILNGDFWTAYYNTFDEFLKTKWSGLFPILKSKKTAYIFGNHDRKEWVDKRVSLFSDWQGDEYKTEINGVKYSIVHGHKYLGDSIATKEYLTFWRKYKFDAIKYMIETIFLRTIGRYFYLPASLMNKKVKKISKMMDNTDYLVIGHTHWAEIDKGNKFINSGLIHSGNSNYILIEDGNPKLITVRF